MKMDKARQKRRSTKIQKAIRASREYEKKPLSRFDLSCLQNKLNENHSIAISVYQKIERAIPITQESNEGKA